MLNKTALAVAVGICLVLSACALKKSPPPAAGLGGEDFNLYFRQGVSFLNQGDYESAAEKFNKAIALNPNSARAHNLRGVAFFQLKNFRNAEEEFRSAVALDASYAEAYNNLGSVFFARQRFDRAIEMFRKALSLSPESVSALYSLGTLLLFQGKETEGMSYLSRGIERDPEFLEKHKALVVDLPTSETDMSEINFTFAEVYAERGNVEKTVEYLEKARKSGFRDWQRILEEKQFETVRDNPKIKEFIR
jgi:Tfp pilus assembly protein PilF